MSIIRWIHFSDLHLGNNIAVDTRLMRKKLPEYIASLKKPFDYAFCSGDTKEWNSDYAMASDYIRQLCSSANVPLDSFFIVPGNHDVEIGGEERSALIKRLSDWNDDYYQSNQGVISEKDISLLKSGQSAFYAFVKELLGNDRANMYHKTHFVITTKQLNILHLDSTVTYGKEHERDFIIGTDALMNALDECDPSKLTIILTHYSFDFLSQSERNEVENLLSTYNVQLWLAGHEHENLIRWQREKFIECQCGNLMLQKDARSCFLTGELDLETGNGMIKVHAWYQGKDWAVYPFVRINSDDDSLFPFQLRLLGAQRTLDVSFEVANASEACNSLAVVGGLFAGVKIKKDILTDLEINGENYTNNEEHAPLGRVMRKLWSDKRNNPELSCNALILGDGGMGKSTMMFHECRELLSHRYLAVYISLQAREGANNESIFDYVLHSLYKAEDEHAKDKFLKLTSSAHSNPDLVLFIDGFNELSGEGAQRYVAEIKYLSTFAGIQIIVSSRLDFLRDYGLSHFWMIRACELRESQIRNLFEERMDDWNNILAQKTLRILLKNPMMALLYASTCPIVERHAEMEYLDWIIPITNASDLLHDYYLAQIAILVERNKVDGNRIFDCMVAIDRVLPELAYNVERKNTILWNEDDFEIELKKAIKGVNAHCLCGVMPVNLRKIQRKFRIHRDSLDDLYDLIISEMVLLKSCGGVISFAHQIFRDYLAAVHLHNCLLDNLSVERLWHHEKIHKGVVQYLRFIGRDATWGTNGTINEMLKPYRGKEGIDGDWFVHNVLNCWLSIGEGEKDLSSLDLRKVSLSEHLKTQFFGTINIDNAWITKETLINDRHHDRIVGMSFSHDNRTMAAISENGLVSITNLLTQSQMIIGELERAKDILIGFDSDDCLMIKMDGRIYKWPTVSYDIIERDVEGEIISLSSVTEEISKLGASLAKRLKESNLDGIIRKFSENGCYLAVGYESGFIQVWDVIKQDCVANLSLNDSQITTVAFTKNGAIAALGAGGKLVQIWDLIQEKCIKTLYFPQRVCVVRLPESGEQLECQFSDGTYYKVDLETGIRHKVARPQNTQPFISQILLDKFAKEKIVEIQSAPDGNAIVLTKNGKVYTWDEKQKQLHYCDGHNSEVKAIAICTADTRFAASYSPEQYMADRNDRNRRGVLNNQKLVRVRIVKTGQCQWRLPTNGRRITKLQFFTCNRIILAGYATNGDILLWELINKKIFDKEHGHWETVEIVHNNQSEPLECAFPDNKKDFISAYADGTILIRPFAYQGNEKRIFTIPGIDAGVFRWSNLKCDDELEKMLIGYKP
ncbi:MAG: metallophosphoesterase [Victivallales bacterium]|nr:metallophosphoesterase [Victivallales bacterium]